MRILTFIAAGAVVVAAVVVVSPRLWAGPGPTPTEDDAAAPAGDTSAAADTSQTGADAGADVGPDAPPVLPTPVFAEPLVGAHVHALWDHYDEDMRAKVLDELVAAGVRSIRVDIGWASLEEECSGCTSDWYVERLDRTVEQARQRGLDILGVLWRTPAWAGNGAAEAPPDDVAEYQRIAGWLADRYAGSIAAWELWNEPNLPDYFHGSVDDYAELVRAAAPAIREADPMATVVLGGPAHSDSAWLREVLERDVGPLVDVVAVHSYPTPADDPPTLPDPDRQPERFAHLTTVLEVVTELAPATPVWLTEFGWSTHETQAGAAAWEHGVSEELQARYAVEALVLLRDQWPAIERAYWYRARDRDTGTVHLDGFGLLDVDGDPKPVLRELDRLLWDRDG